MMMIIHFGKTRYSAITDTSTNTSTASARLHLERGSKTLKRQAITVSMPVLECPRNSELLYYGRRIGNSLVFRALQ